METFDAVIAEPDHLWRGLLLRHLDQSLGRYLFASTAGEALSLVKRHTPRLLVTEMRLPDFSGLELVSRLRSGRYDALKILVFSQAFDREQTEAGLALGVSAYLEKGFMPPHRIASCIHLHIST